MLTGGSTVRLSRGNKRRGTSPLRREKRENCRPSICTGTKTAPALSATMPAPSYTFIRAPVIVMRPSGNTTSVSPSRTTFTIVLVLNGLAGSTVKNFTAARNGRAHQRFAIWMLTAKVGASGRNAATKAPSA